jgi:hypothetical protein
MEHLIANGEVGHLDAGVVAWPLSREGHAED